MKTRTRAMTLVTLSSATAFAAGLSPAGRELPLAEMVTHLESRYPGTFVAIQFDAAGECRPEATETVFRLTSPVRGPRATRA